MSKYDSPSSSDDCERPPSEKRRLQYLQLQQLCCFPCWDLSLPLRATCSPGMLTSLPSKRTAERTRQMTSLWRPTS